MKKHRILRSLIGAATLSLAAATSFASDHADGPTVAGDQAADLADLYMFVDPNDNTKMILINTVRGFIVPGEAGNFAIFDSTIRYRFQIENTGPVDANGKPIPAPTMADVDFDPVPDAFIDVSFSEKTTTAGQTATVVFSGSAFAGIPKGKFIGNATAAGLGATPPGGADYFPPTPQKLKTAGKKPTDPLGPEIDVEFFAGEADDPFFFDIPGFVGFRNRFIANLAVVPGTFADRTAAITDAAAELARGRDTFAGYNVLVMALRIPIVELKSKNVKVTNTTKFGGNVLAQRRFEKTVKGKKVPFGAYGVVDREGLPAINALLVPLAEKNAYNGGTTIDDSKLKFAPGILGTLNALQVSGGSTPPLSAPLAGTQLALAKLAVLDGDFLRFDTTVPAAFPNGRTPANDVVGTLLTILAELGAPVDDNVPANDVTFSANFPYLGLPHQPRTGEGNVEDNTRN